MAEPRPRHGERRTRGRQHPSHGVVRELSERDDHAHTFEQLELSDEIRQAPVSLLGSRLVRRRRAPHGGRDIGVAQLQPVVAANRCLLVGVPGSVQRAEQPVAGTVTGEDPAGSVPAVCRRGQSDDQESSLRVAETGEGTTPVLLFTKRSALLARDAFTPVDESLARSALDDLAGQRVERVDM